MVYNNRTSGKGSPSSVLVDELNSYGAKEAARNQRVEHWFSKAVAANDQMKKNFADARDDINVDYVDSDISGFEDEDDVDRTTFHEQMKNRADEKLGELYESARAGCADLHVKCQMDLPYNFRQTPCLSPEDDCNTPILERKGDGIDYIFEFVESAICGDYSGSKVRKDGPSSTGGKGMTFNDLAGKMPQLHEANLTESYITEEASIVSKSARTARSHKTSSTRSRGRSTASKSSKSQRKRSSNEHSDKHRSRSLHLNDEKKKKQSEKSSKSTSAFIRANAKQSDFEFESGLNHYQDRSRVSSLALKSGKGSAFDDLSSSKLLTTTTADSTTFSSHVPAKVPTTGEVSELRELCVLSIGSGSSVSSFDEDGGHSWSQHTKRANKKISPSPNSVLTATTTNTTNKKSEPNPNPTDTEKVIDGIVRALKVLANFIHSLSSNMYGYGVAAPVNKAFCLLSVAFIFLFWPEDIEKNRVRIEKVEIPKKTAPASLLTLVTQGLSPREGQGVSLKET